MCIRGKIVNKQTYIKSPFFCLSRIHTPLSLSLSSLLVLPISAMRGIALPVLLAVTLATAVSADDKVRPNAPCFSSLFSHSTQSPPKSKHLFLRSSPRVGKTGGLPLRPLRRLRLAVKRSPTLANGQSKKLPTPSWRAIVVSLQRVPRLTTPYLPPSTRPSTFRTSHSSFSMRSNTKKVATAVVDTSNSSRMASRLVERSSLTTLLGSSCSVLTSLARAQRLVSLTRLLNTTDFLLCPFPFPSSISSSVIKARRPASTKRNT